MTVEGAVFAIGFRRGNGKRVKRSAAIRNQHKAGAYGNSTRGAGDMLEGKTVSRIDNRARPRFVTEQARACARVEFELHPMLKTRNLLIPEYARKAQRARTAVW